MAFHNSTGGAIAQINMTPMIDLLLVMLIIFLVMAPVHPKGLTAALPQATRSTSDAYPESNVVLVVAQDGSIRLNSLPVKREDLTAVLAEIFRMREDRTIFVRGAGDLLFGQMAEVIDLARTGGADRIALLTGS